MIKYSIYHQTSYNYNQDAQYSDNLARLTPLNNKFQNLTSHEIIVTPNTGHISQDKDQYGNTTTNIFINTPHKELSVITKSIVQVNDEFIKEYIHSLRHIDLTLTGLQSDLKNIYPQNLNAIHFLSPSPLIPRPNQEMIDYAKQSFNKYSNLFEAISDLTKRIYKDFTFDSEFSDINTPLEVIFKEKKGVCQDFASLCISILREFQIPVRYSSGYIQTYPAQGQEKLFGTDASHAWISVWFGRYGWVDFDPTNNKLVNEEYVLLAYGRDYQDISPLTGVVKTTGSSSLTVKVDMSIIN